MSDQSSEAIEYIDDTHSLRLRIAGNEYHVPVEHAAEYHELLGNWLGDNDAE
jgi:hypothetical protein